MSKFKNFNEKAEATTGEIIKRNSIEQTKEKRKRLKIRLAIEESNERKRLKQEFEL